MVVAKQGSIDEDSQDPKCQYLWFYGLWWKKIHYNKSKKVKVFIAAQAQSKKQSFPQTQVQAPMIFFLRSHRETLYFSDWKLLAHAQNISNVIQHSRHTHITNLLIFKSDFKSDWHTKNNKF